MIKLCLFLSRLDKSNFRLLKNIMDEQEYNCRIPPLWCDVKSIKGASQAGNCVEIIRNTHKRQRGKFSDKSLQVLMDVRRQGAIP